MSALRYTAVIRNGSLAAVAMFALYFAIVSAVSGISYAKEQFVQFAPFIVSLALGFGLQIGLYTYLRQIAGVGSGSRGAVAVTGTTSGLAMVSCCAHYAANLLPLLGTLGIVSFVAAYQTELFWVGILFNILGIFFLLRRILLVNRMHRS